MFVLLLAKLVTTANILKDNKQKLRIIDYLVESVSNLLFYQGGIDVTLLKGWVYSTMWVQQGWGGC